MSRRAREKRLWENLLARTKRNVGSRAVNLENRTNIAGSSPKKLRTKSSDPLNKWWILPSDHRGVRHLTIQSGETFDDALRRFLDQMPRKPYKFLELVAESARRQQVEEKVRAKRERGRKLHEKRYNSLRE